VVQELIAAGADVERRDERGRPPLAWCRKAHHERPALCASLLAAGADPLAAYVDTAGQPRIADDDLVATQLVCTDPATPAATIDRLRVHAMRHITDQPAQAAQLLELITRTRPPRPGPVSRTGTGVRGWAFGGRADDPNPITY
jgi:ankyrin repeat protein